MKSLTISPTNPKEPIEKTGVQPLVFKPIEFKTPIKSRFFQGQFLSDRDLAQLQDWTVQHLSLNRLRDGWGVVSGLMVAADSENSGQVLVAPGYAVDSGGRDIVVDQVIGCDLTQLFSLVDPCERPFPSGEDLLEETVKSVHLFLHYTEKDMMPQTVLGSGSCDEAARCEYSRTKEMYSLSWRRDEGGTDPVNTAVLKWRDGYQENLNCLNSFPFSDLNESNQGAIRYWLRQWIKHTPLAQFNFINHLICNMPKAALDLNVLLRILFWIVLDDRLQFLGTPTSSSQPEDGVLLARVWAEQIAENGKKSVLITAVENEAPQRRLMTTDQWPAPPGLVNGGQFMWQHMAGVTAALTHLGIGFSEPEQMQLPQDSDLPTGIAALRDLFKLSPFLNPQSTVAPVYFDGTAMGLGHRLIGFKNSQELIEPVAVGHWQTPDWVAAVFAEPAVVLVDEDLEKEDLEEEDLEEE